eukprot:TRINITY_DN2208_c0_g1_i1.p1 TRINITY_DN2208_c0_g1~~TRINITY_DN2208_c0_g1_i1.p1  ORF type:complete len:538 (+),score=141.42 TRINITY_DN2208_c0_g1_i1:905-2518(+)
MRVYEVLKGVPTRSRLFLLCREALAGFVMKFLRHRGLTESALHSLRSYLAAELPPSLLQEVLRACILKDNLQCNHNPVECASLKLWRAFYHPSFNQLHILHHEFAFPKTTNYPEITRHLSTLMELILQMQSPNQVTSFKLHLEQCEESRSFIQGSVSSVLRLLAPGLVSLEIPGLASDALLLSLARNCVQLEVLNIRGSREALSDKGFIAFLKEGAVRIGGTLRKLDVSRCSLSQEVLLYLPHFSVLNELLISTSLLRDIHYSTEGHALLLLKSSGEPFRADKLGISSVVEVTVEHEAIIRSASTNSILSHLRSLFPQAKNIHLQNLMARELSASLHSQRPLELSFMRECIMSLELISPDYFEFPGDLYPCPNLESLIMEKPTYDLFSNEEPLDDEEVAISPFVNLRHLSLSRISLTNLSRFLSGSKLREFRVFNIGRRERPRWTDARVKEILQPKAVPALQDFHVSCLPNEGFSTSEMNRYLHLTQETIRYLTHNFQHIRSISGIECWNPRENVAASIRSTLNSELTAGKFALTSI